MSNLFQKLEYEAFRAGITPRTAQSRDWFRTKISTIRRVNRSELMQEEEILLKNRQVMGSMFMFWYDPKHKDTLEYYDAFPLVIVLKPAKGGFLGLNLHYLPPILRAKFLDGLLEVTNNKKYDQTTKFNLTYDLLKRATKLKYFKPCIHHYLTTHVRSRFAMVQAPEWEIAVFLPTADFNSKGSKYHANKVYNDSRKMI
jgi:hypothetical protein